MFDLMYSSSFSDNFYEVVEEICNTDCDRPDIDYLLNSGVCKKESKARQISLNVGSFILGKHSPDSHNFIGFVNDFIDDEENYGKDVREITKKCIGREIEPPLPIIALMCYPRLLDNIRELYKSGAFDESDEESTVTDEDTDFF